MRQGNKHSVLFAVAACALLVAGSDAVTAQDIVTVLSGAGQGGPAASAAGAVEAIALKVEIVLTRSQGARKISSLPYTLVIPAVPVSSAIRDNPVIQPQGQSASLRLGVDVNTGRTLTSTNDGKTSSTAEYQYIGTNIDCRADYRSPGTYRVYVNLTDTSLSAGLPGDVTTKSVPAGIRRFSASNTLSVRDGQPAQFMTGTDPLTGETIRVDVTATAIK